MPRKTKKPGWIYATWVMPSTCRMDAEMPAFEFMAFVYGASTEDERAKMMKAMTDKAAKMDERDSTAA